MNEVLGLYFVVAMVIHRHIGSHRKKGVQWPKLKVIRCTLYE